MTTSADGGGKVVMDALRQTYPRWLTRSALAALLTSLVTVLGCGDARSDVDAPDIASASETSAASTGPSGESPTSVADPPVVRWHCRNDLEVSCAAGACSVEPEFTPMSVTVDDAGGIAVCAYSGCWEGVATVEQSARFLILLAHDLEFSTAPTTREDIVVVVDGEDRVAIVKAGAFALPMLCETLGGGLP